MERRSGIVIVCAFLLFSGCNSIYDNADGFSYAYMQRSCGPVDGPAFEVYISDERADCDRLPQVVHEGEADQTVLKVWVYGTNEPEVPSTYTFGSPPTDHEGTWARWCRKGQECVDVEGGIVRFSTVGAVTIVFVELSFEGGAKVETSLPVRRCERSLLCG